MSPSSVGAALDVLRIRFGHSQFRPGQSQAVASVLADRETLVILPTGGGKSLCYQVPALMLPGLTVVVSPLISLMKDQVDALARRLIPSAFVNSTLSSSQVSDRLAQAKNGVLKLLYVAPERFEAGGTLDRLRDVKVSLLAIDEAHCVSAWGHDFRPSYLRLASIRTALGNPTLVALTATATPQVRQDIVRQLRMTRPVTIVTGFDRRNLRYSVRSCRTDADKDRLLVEELSSNKGLAIVYASTRRAVERVSAMLDQRSIRSLPYHAGLDDDHRREVQDAFVNEDVRAIVATNAFGMGIDKPNVRLVVHHTMPGTLEAYYQEAGRAGRDGGASECVLLHAYRDRFTHEYFINSAHADRAVVERVYTALKDAHEQRVESPTLAQLVARVGRKASVRDVEAALRLLERTGARCDARASGSLAYVRLLATPARIMQELSANRALELGMLRTLWRVGREKLNDGLNIDLGGLPPAFSGPQAVPILDSLQGDQFLEWRRVASSSCLTQPAAPLSKFAIDWETLQQRHDAEIEKLEIVQRYGYTKRCRRAFVLRYFGDPAVQPRCDACDNCVPSRADRKPVRRRQHADAS